MNETLLIALLVVLLIIALACLVLLTILLTRRQALTGDPSADRTPELLGQLTTLERLTTAHLGQLRTDLGTQRDELGNVVGRGQMSLQQTLEGHRTSLEKIRETVDARLVHQQTLVQTALALQTKALTDLQEAMTQNLRDIGEKLVKTALDGRVEDRKSAEALAQHLRDRLALMVERIDKLSESLKNDAETSRKTLEQKMGDLQASNEQRLELMRQTVDEKLHATLEARLGESFKLVSDRLEAVQKGLGEMKSLADGVGDLKKVMTNVKTRGTWGEVQLRALIEDILRPEEFVENYAPNKTGGRVEFAVRLPGNQQDSHIYLPIDSKFPVEDYTRLVDAQDAADLDGAKLHGKALENRIKGCAKDIADKYLVPGVTTDFAILFLPFEGLYAEVLRRPGLAEHIQREQKVVVCGPTTLGAVLNSLRMGFRAVAIAKRSGDIGELLGAVKTEFGNFSKVIDAVGNRLRQAQDEIEKIGTRTRAINRKLKSVEALPEAEAQLLLPPTLEALEDE
ncbi:MAG: DNA recombination protein RmuC [Myxococcales bacterium]|nr:DNA recombination protein RmuC [Myxococcales bacterium]